MATLREFIFTQSTLVAGKTVREHIQSPCDCDGEEGSLECGATADVDYSAVTADVGDLLAASVIDVVLEANLDEILSASVETETLIGEVCP